MCKTFIKAYNWNCSSRTWLLVFHIIMVALHGTLSNVCRCARLQPLPPSTGNSSLVVDPCSDDHQKTILRIRGIFFSLKFIITFFFVFLTKIFFMITYTYTGRLKKRPLVPLREVLKVFFVRHPLY